MSRPHLISLLLISALLLGACSKQGPTETPTAPTLVRVVKPVSGPGAAPIVSTGIVTAADEIKLSFKLGGVIQHIAVREGERVLAGQKLAELVPTEINAQLTQAQQLNEKAQRDLERGERLYADQVIALEQLQDLRTQANVAAAQLQSVNFNSGFARITAPSAGTILRRLAEDHEVVAPGQPVLMLGASNKGYIVRAALADRDAVQLKVGDAATVQLDAAPGKTLNGRVSEVGGAAQLENGLFPIEIQLDSTATTLVAGMVAQVSIQPAASKTSLLYVPTGAIVAGVDQQASVFVLQGAAAKKRQVQVAFFTRDQVALREGLTADEQVITDGALYLSDGEQVSVQAANKSTAMQLLEFPIRRYQFTLVAFLCLVAIGWYAFTTIPREEDPFFKSPAFSIPVIYPGADPKEIERLIVKPIEDRIAALDDVFKLETTIVNGVSVIFVQFGPSSDADKKYDEVTREVGVVRDSLNSTVASIGVRKWSPGYVNIVQIALVSADAPYSELEDTARDLADALKAVSGVRTAETWAIPARELRVALNLARMSQLRITPTQVMNALQSENAAIPAGFIDLGARSFSLKASDSFNSADEVRDTVVAVNNGQLTRVKDIAEVRWDSAPLSYIGRYNGERAVFVTAQQQDQQNILKTNERIAAAVENFQRTNLPARIKLEWGFKQADNVAHRLNSLYLDFGIAVGLVMITLLPLGLRAAGIVMIAIPLSLAFGLTVLYFVGYSLNQISIAGFVVALGLLVDDSIVVVENITRHLRQGHSRTQAALLATKQIFEAILGCTATLVFAFLPLLMLPGDAGKFIRVLPTAIVATVLGSLIVALFVIPFLASRLLKEEGHNEGSPLLQKVMAVIHRYYQPALRTSLARPKTTAWLAIGGSLLLSALVIPILGASLFPKADTPRFLINVSTPNGSSFAETRKALDFVEAKLKGMPEVSSYFSNLGHGNPQIYYNHIPTEDAANYAELYVLLKEYDARATPLLLDKLRTQLDTYANARIYVREFTNGIPISAPVSVRVLGPDLEVLERLSHQIEALVKQTPGTRDVKNPMRVARTNLRLKVDSAKANLLGVPTVEFDRAVRMAVSGISAGKFRDAEGEQYDIMLRAPVGERATVDTLQQTRVATVTGQSLPLSQLATLQFESAPILIQRFSRERAVVIDADAERGENVGKLTSAVVAQLDQFNWPAGYHYELGGEAASSAESFSGIGTAIIIAIFGIFAILVLEFGNFKSTLIVLTVIPLGVLGGLLMLLITGNDISFTASIGFIGLIGIEIKNSILLVDFTNQLRREGVPLDEAIERAGEVRFLPILLTSATAIGGLLPLALENTGIYSPLAWVIIGGLITSTLLARLVTPVMYKLLAPAIEA